MTWKTTEWTYRDRNGRRRMGGRDVEEWEKNREPDFHDMARILESMARAMRHEADRRWEERKRIMMRIVIEKETYERGLSDGKSGRPSHIPPGSDEFSYYSGYIEGKAVRERTKCHLFVPEDHKKERG